MGRSWAVEWEDSAIDFLLDKGFDSNLGARPLKRAIERHLLSPLAITIVNHQFPDGDQFLFVRSDGNEIFVEFIDPDIPEDGPVEIKESDLAQQEDRAYSLGSIALEAHGNFTEMEFLRRRYDDLTNQIEKDSWRSKKQSYLDQMSIADFWNSPERFTILGEAEYMDRIEAGLKTAGSLIHRLTKAPPGSRNKFSRDLMKRLAQQIYLIDAACCDLGEDRPREALLRVKSLKDSVSAESDISRSFAIKLGNMYKQWATKRRMQLKVLLENRGMDKLDDDYELLLGISGYAAFSILKPESGLHVLEYSSNDKNHQRSKVRVQVLPQSDNPLNGDLKKYIKKIRKVLKDNQERELNIVRLYREGPSPLVKDNVRHWKTGRLNRVLEGDFDLICN